MLAFDRSGSSLSLRGLQSVGNANSATVTSSTGGNGGNGAGGNSATNQQSCPSPAHRTVHRSISATTSKPSRRASSGGETNNRESSSTTTNSNNTAATATTTTSSSSSNAGANHHHNILCSLLPYSPLPVSLMIRASESMSHQGRKKPGKCARFYRVWLCDGFARACVIIAYVCMLILCRILLLYAIMCFNISFLMYGVFSSFFFLVLYNCVCFGFL